jgi:hypothetical protein
MVPAINLLLAHPQRSSPGYSKHFEYETPKSAPHSSPGLSGQKGVHPHDKLFIIASSRAVRDIAVRLHRLGGQIAGYYDSLGSTQGFLREPDGTFITFGPVAQATAMNQAGDITGYYFGADGTNHGFLRMRNGKFKTFDAPGAGTDNISGTFPQAMDGGTITGYYVDREWWVSRLRSPEVRARYKRVPRKEKISPWGPGSDFA